MYKRVLISTNRIWYKQYKLEYVDCVADTLDFVVAMLVENKDVRDFNNVVDSVGGVGVTSSADVLAGITFKTDITHKS